MTMFQVSPVVFSQSGTRQREQEKQAYIFFGDLLDAIKAKERSIRKGLFLSHLAFHDTTPPTYWLVYRPIALALYLHTHEGIFARKDCGRPRSAEPMF